jgi:membrane protease YdiL (CAAX protease family)
VPTVPDTVLVLVIVLGLAVRAWFGMRELRAMTAEAADRRRPVMWLRAILSQWALVAAVLAWWGVEHRPVTALGLDPRLGWGFAGFAIGLVAIVGVMVLQGRLVARDASLRDRVRARLAPVERLMPSSRAEYPGFASLALTAGICEELLFRGFVTWALAHVLPGAWQVLLAQAALFGLAHAYQGVRGIVTTGFVGLVMGLLVWITGSLWASMIVHALMDLHAGDLMLRVREADAAAPAAAS